MNDLNYPIKVSILVDNCINVPYLKIVILRHLEGCIKKSSGVIKIGITKIYDAIKICENQNNAVVTKLAISSTLSSMMEFVKTNSESIDAYMTLWSIIQC